MNDDKLKSQLFGKPNKIAEMMDWPLANRAIDQFTDYLSIYGKISEDQLYKASKDIYERNHSREDVYEYFYDTILRVNSKVGIPFIVEAEGSCGLELLEYVSAASEVRIQGKYKIVRPHCFRHCPNIEKLTFSYGVKTLFRYSDSPNRERLREVVLPPHVSLLDGVFLNCSNLEAITFKGGFREDYDLFNFRGTKWYEQLGKPFVIYKNIVLEYTGQEKKVVIPEGVMVIGSMAFYGDNIPNHTIKEIVLPQSVRKIRSFAFMGCEQLKRIIIPNGVRVIESAFTDNYELEAICIPPSVTKLRDIYGFGESIRYTKLFIADTPYLRRTARKYEWDKVEFIDYSKEPFKDRDTLVAEIQGQGFSEETIDEAQEMLGIGTNLYSMNVLVKTVTGLLHDNEADFAVGIHDMLYGNLDPYLKKYQ